VGGDTRRIVPHQRVPRQQQGFGLILVQALVPFLEGRGLKHALRQLTVIEGKDKLVVNQNVGAPRLMLELLNRRRQLPIVTDESQVRDDSSGNQSLADEDLTRMSRLYSTVVHSTPGIDQ